MAEVERRWGRIDAWVNNAMVTIYAPSDRIQPDELRRVTNVSYHGAVWGTQAALKRMRARGNGTIIQVGSALAYRSIPLQSAYCAAKHALLGFTESLRTELLHEKSGIHLTLVHLPAVNTPQFNWALNRMPKRPQPVPPVFQPEMIADVIVRASHRRRREWFVAFPTFKAVWADKLLPQVADWYLARTGFDSQQGPEAEDTQRPCNLWDPMPAEYYTSRGRFSDIAEEQKAVNLAANPRCALTTGTDRFRTGLDIVVEGAAVRVTDRRQLERLAAKWLAKIDWRFDAVEGGFRDPGRPDDGGVPDPTQPQAHVFGVAPTVEMAEEVALTGTRQMFYARLPDVKGTAGGVAFPLDEVVEVSPAYRWTLNHTVRSEHPLELFELHSTTVDGLAADQLVSEVA